MLSIKSKWFQHSPARSSLLPTYEGKDRDDELTSKVPPPILSSFMLPQAGAFPHTSTATSAARPLSDIAPIYSPEWLMVIDRKEKQLQHQVQLLLDEQAEGLTVGLGGAPFEDGISEGSLTPTKQSTYTSRSISARRGSTQRLGLRDARRGIYHAIHGLEALNLEKSEIIENDISQKEDVLQQINDWEQRERGLREEISTIEHSPEQLEVDNLKEEASSLIEDIRQTELRLSGMKAHHRQLIHRISAIDNSVQSKLSSYNASLQLLDSQIKDFLARPQAETEGVPPRESSFLRLPAKRRTLDMAKESFHEVLKALRKQQSETAAERDALEDGALVWKDMIREVGAFEKRLRQALLPHASSAKENALSEERGQGLTISGAAMSDMICALDHTILQVEEKVKLAEARGWKLLICCMGAELEALRLGKELLEDASVAADGGGNDLSNELINGTDACDFAQAESRSGTLREDKQTRVESDEEPDPDLLLSHHDTDTE